MDLSIPSKLYQQNMDLMTVKFSFRLRKGILTFLDILWFSWFQFRVWHLRLSVSFPVKIRWERYSLGLIKCYLDCVWRARRNIWRPLDRNIPKFFATWNGSWITVLAISWNTSKIANPYLGNLFIWSNSG